VKPYPWEADKIEAIERAAMWRMCWESIGFTAALVDVEKIEPKLAHILGALFLRTAALEAVLEIKELAR
jgi:hypothetical protein